MFAELHARSAFSFLRAASSPEQLAARAAELGLGALAVCDRNGVYGAPRLFGAAKEHGLRALVGCELALDDGTVLPVLVRSRAGYQALCRLLTTAHLRAAKGACRVRWDELPQLAGGCVALTGDEEGPLVRALAAGGADAARACLRRLVDIFGADDLRVELQRHRVRGEEDILRGLADVAQAGGVATIASNGVLHHTPEARDILDVFTCLRHHVTLDTAGRLLARNDARHLVGEDGMRALFRAFPGAVDRAWELACALPFTLADLGYAFPRYPVPEGETMDSFLRKMTWFGAEQRYGGLSCAVRAQLERELALIQKLGFSGYFLVVWDIVNFARERGILVQGRGSAANSAVCYSLGITAVDPVGSKLLFERFLSEGREGWPDIDLDLPSGDDRERVIQEVYRRYGPRGAAMTANVITYRGRSAMRELGKVLGLPADILGRFSSMYAGGDFPHTLGLREHVRAAGLPPEHPRAAALFSLHERLRGLPRHLGQHSGGMIVCQGALDAVVPLENASMPGRVVAQWDKDDCEDLGIIKVDLLGLGMMAVLQECLRTTQARGRGVDLAHIPKDDPATFDLLCRADTIGTFQVESRAQMATLPRLQPRVFYDLAIEVALIRPGPIQGDMVNPYLERRAGRQPVRYLHESVRPVLERTLGVALFQEQVLKMAMVLAGFSGAQAEELRRALSFHRSEERMQRVERKLRAAMRERGHDDATTDELVRATQSFALYGFPESHAISFALIAYASCWLKVHRPAEFYAALLNNQPMGFYAPATLVQDARRRGLRVLPVCVVRSGWDATVEADDTFRIGLRSVRGLRRVAAARLVAERERAPFASLEDLLVRTDLDPSERRVLAAVGAFQALAAHRREALWRVALPVRGDDLLAPVELAVAEGGPLQPMDVLERHAADLGGVGLTVGAHPMAVLRADVPECWTASELQLGADGERVRCAGAVICRQRPGTAKGVVFVSLEDETGIANAILHAGVFERHRAVVTQERFLVIEGTLQNREGVVHVLAERLEGLRAAVPAPEPRHFH